MLYVEFKDCVVDEVNVVSQRLRAWPDEVQAEFESLFDHYANVEMKYWRGDIGHKGYKQMQGPYQALRQFYVNMQGNYRLSAYRGPGKEMILLAGWSHNSDEAQELGANLALERRRLVQQGLARRVDHVL